MIDGDWRIFVPPGEAAGDYLVGRQSGKQAAAPGRIPLPRHVPAEIRRARANTRAAMRASTLERSLEREGRAGRYSIMATDCVKHPPRRVCREETKENRAIESLMWKCPRNGQTEKKE